MCTQVYICLLIFFKWFLQKDVEDMSMLIVFLLIISLGYKSFSHHNEMISFIFFPIDFEGIYMTIEHKPSKGGVLRITYYIC
jgi:hypothetical protein